MIWQDKLLTANRDFMDAFVKVSTKEEAQEFLALALVDSPHARENIGCMAGYFDNDTKQRVYNLFGVEHPIFGRLDTTFHQALAFGVAHGMAREQGKPHQEALKFAHEICSLPDEEVKKWLADYDPTEEELDAMIAEQSKPENLPKWWPKEVSVETKNETNSRTRRQARQRRQAM